MSVESLSAISAGPAEAAEAAARAQRLQELVSTSAGAGTTTGASSFAAALQAASAEGGAPPEAPEPGEGEPSPETGSQASTAESSGLASTSASTYSSPYVSAESSAIGALDTATAGTTESAIGAESPEVEALGSAYGATSSTTPSYLDTSSAAYAPGEDSATGDVDASGDYASSLDGGVYSSSTDATPATGTSTADASGADASGADASGAGATDTTGTSATDASGASAYTSLIDAEASRNGVDPALLQGLIEQESGFDPNAESSAGARGLTQLMPSTASSLGVTDAFDPQQAIAGGAKLLGELLRQFDGNTSDALAAYNAGAGAVEQYGGVPPYPETEAYVTKVLANARSYSTAS